MMGGGLVLEKALVVRDGLRSDGERLRGVLVMGGTGARRGSDCDTPPPYFHRPPPYFHTRL